MSEAGISRSVSAKGVFVVGEQSIRLETDCTVTFELSVPAPGGDTSALTQMRGILTNGGNEILAFQTDPGGMVAARLIADP